MNNKEWIDNVFFGEIIECFMLADLAKIESNLNSSSKCGNCNFPLTLQIFSCMDFIGWLISYPENDPEATDKNIQSFVLELFGSNRKAQIQQVSKFTKIFRHGLAHEYFAKAAGISRKGNDLLCLDLDKEALVLDADVLLEEFRLAMNQLEEKVHDNSALGTQIRMRYKTMQDNNSLVTKGLITKSHSKDTSTISTSLNLPTYSSNASVPPPSTTFPPNEKS